MSNQQDYQDHQDQLQVLKREQSAIKQQIDSLGNIIKNLDRRIDALESKWEVRSWEVTYAALMSDFSAAWLKVK